jgi:hypothetical protein
MEITNLINIVIISKLKPKLCFCPEFYIFLLKKWGADQRETDKNVKHQQNNGTEQNSQSVEKL